MPDITFFNISKEDAFKNLDTNDKGLTTKEVTRRQGYYGLNKLPEEAATPWYKLFIEQFKSSLVFILVIAAGISFGLEEPVDGTVILAAVVIQVLVGFVQEFRAQRSLAALKQVISLSARVLRNGKEGGVAAEALVPGDIVLLSAGDKVPADVRLIEVHDFEVDEAPLTGESEPIKKQIKVLDNDTDLAERSNMAFTGTVATKGQAIGMVTFTGQYTEIGKIAQLIKDTEDEPTPLQDKLTQFSKRISIVVVIIAVAIAVFGYFTQGDFTTMFTVAVAVAVSAIPEGLAVAVTIILAVGMQRMIKRDALVRKLLAAETLGSTNVICTDKTGTLTEGNMQITDIITWENNFAVDGTNTTHDKNGARDLIFSLRLGLLCNDAKVDNIEDNIGDWKISGNLTERALLMAGSQAGLHFHDIQKEAPRIDAIPFDSSIKYMATLHREAQGRMLYVKGAPEIIISKCSKVMASGKAISFDKVKQKKFQKKFIQLSKQGLRIIALAYKNTGEATKEITDNTLSDLVFVGYVGIKDPLRKEAKQTVARCLDAGIQTVMITGDHKLTAQAIAKELGLKFDEHNIMEGKELDSLSQHELNKRVKDITVYARVTPEHKLRIVNAWQANDMVVAMTGDGINDSPAIKAADIGIALGSGTDVAKETADMVILDDNFETIVEAVEEGRGIFDNIKKTVLYLLSDSFSEVILIIGALLLGLPIPITAAQILWINLIDDSFPSLAMTQEPKELESMKEKPRGRKAQILDGEVKILIVIISVVTGFMNLARFYFVYSTTGDLDLARTVVFLSLGIDSLFYMFSVRSMRKMIWQKNLFSNKWLIGAFFLGILFQVIPIYVPFFQKYINTVPLGWEQWVVALSLSVAVIVSIETIKFIFLHVLRKKNPEQELQRA